MKRLAIALWLALLPAAARNVLAHLIDLHARNLLIFQGPAGPDTPFRPA